MPGRTLLRMALVLWLARLTLQGGTRYGLGPQAANGYSPKFKGKGQGATQLAGNGGKSNGADKMLLKGYGAASTALGNGAKPNGGRAPPAAVKGNGGGYGSKPSKPGYGQRPSYGGIGVGMGPQLAAKQRGGYGNNNGYGYKAHSFKGYGKGQGGQAAYPQAGASLGGGGFSNGAKATKPGFGTGSAGQNGQGANPYVNSTSNSVGLGTYPTAGAKGPKPGYGPVTNGNEKASKGASLGPQAPRVPVMPTYTKGVVLPAEPMPTRGVPSAPEPTIGVPLLIKNEKGPKPEMQPQILNVQQGKAPKPVILQPAQVFPQSKGPKPALPASSVSLGQVPVAPESFLQGKASKPAQPAPVFPFVPQGKVPNPIPQVPQPVVPHPALVFPQGVAPNMVIPQQAVSQVNTQRPVVSVMPQSKASKLVAPAPVPQLPQIKDPKPVAPVPFALQTEGPPPAPEPTGAMPQMKGPKAANPELTGLGQTNGQRAKPAKPDCGPGGVPGQWTKLPNPGFGPGAWYPNSGGAKATKSGLGGYGTKPKQPDYANGQVLLPVTGYGYGNGPAGLSETVKGIPGNGYQPATGGTGQLPYNGAPIVPAGLDGTSQIQPQTAELGPEAKSGGAYGTQPLVGSEGKSQTKYGIGGLPFAGLPMGYGLDPYGSYGNPYVAQPYAPKPAGKYGVPYNPKPLGLSVDPKSMGKYGIGGLPYGGQHLGPGSKAKSSGKYGSQLGMGGLPYGGQPLNLGPDAGKSGKYGQPAMPYAPESISFGGEAKLAGKYDQPALPFDSGLVGPVTDGQSVAQPALPYEALPPGPEIDGMKSVDQFGEGEIPPQPDAALVHGFGEGDAKSAGTGSYISGGIQPEAISFPAAPTAGPSPALAGSASLPLVTAALPETGPSSLGPPQAEPPSPQLPSLMLQPVTPQQIHIQQKLKVHLHPQGKSWTGGTEGKYDLKGFLGNGYQG
ncbi:calymmin [Pygocentrus nattereri]|uniref:calymmin n=1 Tax=Pygocentrus nattereri TaxID=42514 RepID=UPI0018911D13|nr:calymmin [Pygocentrus nattereri]